jgi:hypothetical protein
LSDLMELPQARIEHALPGRLRLRIPSRRGDRRYFEAVGGQIATLTGVRSLRANPITGGLLIEHATGTDAIASFAREHGLFNLSSAPADPPRAEAPRARSAAAFPNPLALVAAGLAAAGVYQVARGRVLGSASEQLWNSYSAYATLKKPWIAATLAVAGLYQAVAGKRLGSAVSLFFYALHARRLSRGQTPK